MLEVEPTGVSRGVGDTMVTYSDIRINTHLIMCLTHPTGQG